MNEGCPPAAEQKYALTKQGQPFYFLTVETEEQRMAVAYFSQLWLKSVSYNISS